jgi:ABC-type amino acid transport substrate-binding protein
MKTRFANWLRYGTLFIFIIGIGVLFGDFIREFQGFTIAVIAGTPYEIQAHQFINVAEIKIYNDNRQIFHELANRHVEGVLTDRLAGFGWIQKNEYRNIMPVGELLDRENVSIAFLPEDDSLREAVNRALITIIHNGTYGRISHKYFGRNISAPVPLNRSLAAVDDSWRKIQRKGQIVIAMEEQGNYPFDLELAEAICEQLGVKLIPVMVSWEGMSEGLWRKRYDGIWGISARIDEWMNHGTKFSLPMYYTGSQLFARKDSRIKDPDVLQQEKPFESFSLSKLFPKIPRIFEN